MPLEIQIIFEDKQNPVHWAWCELQNLINPFTPELKKYILLTF